LTGSRACVFCWHVYYGDIHVGTIAVRPGVPVDADQWGWACGCYPGTEPQQDSDGTAATFDQARVDFEAAWEAPAANPDGIQLRPLAPCDWHEQKYAKWERGEKVPSQIPTTLMTCP